MCFYHDHGDWIARVHETETRKSDKLVKCHECFRYIPAGVAFTHIEMREWECCRVCDPETRAEAYDHDSSGAPEDEPLVPCEDDKHDYGETDEHRICEECQKLLHAIQLVEEDEGCQGHETQPGYGELREAMWESDGAQEYIDRARELYPELAMSGHLDEFYECTPEWRHRFEEFDCDDWSWDEDDVGPTDEPGGES